MKPRTPACLLLTTLVVAAGMASEAAADEQAKLDVEHAAMLCAELPKIVAAGWQFANRMKVAPSVSRDPRLSDYNLIKTDSCNNNSLPGE